MKSERRRRHAATKVEQITTEPVASELPAVVVSKEDLPVTGLTAFERDLSQADLENVVELFRMLKLWRDEASASAMP